EKKFYKVEKLTIDFVRKWIQRTPKNTREILSAYHQELIKLKDNKFENQFLKQFGFLSWIEGKISESSFNSEFRL
ncbi:MAG: hypothetical protein C0490_25825, partial [Marivirga sp.]|nr:hypothetical protein [Marivirga sp.]